MCAVLSVSAWVFLLVLGGTSCVQAQFPPTTVTLDPATSALSADSTTLTVAFQVKNYVGVSPVGLAIPAGTHFSSSTGATFRLPANLSLSVQTPSQQDFDRVAVFLDDTGSTVSPATARVLPLGQPCPAGRTCAYYCGGAAIVLERNTPYEVFRPRYALQASSSARDGSGAQNQRIWSISANISAGYYQANATWKNLWWNRAASVSRGQFGLKATPTVELPANVNYYQNIPVANLASYALLFQGAPSSYSTAGLTVEPQYFGTNANQLGVSDASFASCATCRAEAFNSSCLSVKGGSYSDQLSALGSYELGLAFMAAANPTLTPLGIQRYCGFNYNARVDASYQAYGMFETGYAQFVSCFTVNSSLTFTFSLSTAVLQAYATSNPGYPPALPPPPPPPPAGVLSPLAGISPAWRVPPEAPPPTMPPPVPPVLLPPPPPGPPPPSPRPPPPPSPLAASPTPPPPLPPPPPPPSGSPALPPHTAAPSSRLAQPLLPPPTIYLSSPSQLPPVSPSAFPALTPRPPPPPPRPPPALFQGVRVGFKAKLANLTVAGFTLGKQQAYVAALEEAAAKPGSGITAQAAILAVSPLPASSRRRLHTSTSTGIAISTVVSLSSSSSKGTAAQPSPQLAAAAAELSQLVTATPQGIFPEVVFRRVQLASPASVSTNGCPTNCNHGVSVNTLDCCQCDAGWTSDFWDPTNPIYCGVSYSGPAPPPPPPPRPPWPPGMMPPSPPIGWWRPAIPSPPPPPPPVLIETPWYRKINVAGYVMFGVAGLGALILLIILWKTRCCFRFWSCCFSCLKCACCCCRSRRPSSDSSEDEPRPSRKRGSPKKSWWQKGKKKKGGKHVDWGRGNEGEADEEEEGRGHSRRSSSSSRESEAPSRPAEKAGESGRHHGKKHAERKQGHKGHKKGGSNDDPAKHRHRSKSSFLLRAMSKFTRKNPAYYEEEEDSAAEAEVIVSHASRPNPAVLLASPPLAALPAPALTAPMMSPLSRQATLLQAQQSLAASAAFEAALMQQRAEQAAAQQAAVQQAALQAALVAPPLPVQFMAGDMYGSPAMGASMGVGYPHAAAGALPLQRQMSVPSGAVGGQPLQTAYSLPAGMRVQHTVFDPRLYQ